MAAADPAGLAGLVLVVDVSSFTEDGFVGTTEYEGKKVDVEFDDAGAGLFLPAEMASRLGVRKGSGVTLSLEGEVEQSIELTVTAVGKPLRISDQKAYYGIGREGGAVLRLRKA